MMRLLAAQIRSGPDFMKLSDEEIAKAVSISESPIQSFHQVASAQLAKVLSIFMPACFPEIMKEAADASKKG